MVSDEKWLDALCEKVAERELVDRVVRLAKVTGYELQTDPEHWTYSMAGRNLIRLLRMKGSFGRCNGCRKPVIWVKTKNARWCPYTATGLAHWADCPKAKDFKRKKT